MTKKSMIVKEVMTTEYQFFVEYLLHVTWSFLNASREEWSEKLIAIINKLGGK